MTTDNDYSILGASMSVFLAAGAKQNYLKFIDTISSDSFFGGYFECIITI